METDEPIVPEIPGYLSLFHMGDCGDNWWFDLEKKGNGDLSQSL